MPRTDRKTPYEDDPDFEIGHRSISTSSKKRKRENALESSGKKIKDDDTPLNSNNSPINGSAVSAINEEKGNKIVPKMKTLDEIFASMRKPVLVPVPKPKPASTVQPKEITVVDLTSPEPPKKVKLAKKKVTKSPTQSCKLKKRKEPKVKLRIALNMKRKRRIKKLNHDPGLTDPTDDSSDSVKRNGSSRYGKTDSISQRIGKNGSKSHERSNDIDRASPGRLKSLKQSKKKEISPQIEEISSTDDVKGIKTTKNRRKIRNYKAKKLSCEIQEISSSDDVTVTPKKVKKTKPSRSDKTSEQRSSPCPRQTLKKNISHPLFTKRKIVVKPAKLLKNTGKKMTTLLNNIPIGNGKKSKVEVRKSPRKSSSDGVICLGEMKKPIPVSTEIPEKKKENYGLTSLPCETVLWTEKYEPTTSSEIIGNSIGVTRLLEWLKEWKERWEKETELNETQTKNEENDSDSDFELDMDDKAEMKKDARDHFSKVAVLIGPCGCGKTATVSACVKELKFKVLEMNTSSHRSSKQILSQLHEATLSHQVSKSNAFNFFNIKESSSKIKANGDSLILLKDADIIFEDDKHFWSAVDTLITDTKRPVVLTTSDSSILTKLDKKYEKIYFHRPSPQHQLHLINSIAEKENFDVTTDWNCDFRMVNDLLHCDIRKTIHNLHFWSSGMTSTSPKETPKRGRKRRSTTSDKFKIQNMFAKVAGIYSAELHSKSEFPSSLSYLSSILMSPIPLRQENLDEHLRIAETVASQMLLSRLPPVLRINWWSLMYCYRNNSEPTVGKRPLEISTPPTTIDTERDFLYDYSSDDCKVLSEQEADPDVLRDEDPDVHLVSVKSTTRSNIEQKCNSEITSPTLGILSKTADVMAIVDLIYNSYNKILKKNDESSLDVARCRISDGLLDVFSSENELSYHSMARSCDIQAALESRAIILGNSRLSELTPDVGVLSHRDILSLSLPHEGWMLKNSQYLRRSLQCQFIGGAFVTSHSFTTDFMPSIRSIVRSEQRRKDARKCRRFMHYFDTIRVFPKTTELSRLLNDFKEIETTSKS